MAKSKIEWTDKTWNPVTGCTKVSQGCKNCYAERMYERFNGHGSFKNVLTHPERLQQPMHWKKPAMVFVNSMSDLFHEDVPDNFIAEVFDIMCQTPQHIYQVLTKRPERMLDLIIECKLTNSKNIWLGVSVEDQDTANVRIPLLVQVPAAVRFLSCEPLLGKVDLADISPGGTYFFNCLKEPVFHTGWIPNPSGLINWVICGGESGPAARPMHPDWARSLRDQCAAAGVPFFFKQWGEWAPVEEVDPTGDIIWLDHKSDELKERKNPVKHLCINHDGRTSKNANEVIIPGEKNQILYKFGKKVSANLLDGKQYLEFPKINETGRKALARQ